MDSFEQRIPAIRPLAPDGGIVLIDVRLGYAPSDPLAISLTVSGDTYLISRDLLSEGLQAMAGVGRVQLRRTDEATLTITFDQVTTIEMGAHSVDTFLQSTYQAVPVGAEVIDIDQMLYALGV